MSRFEGSWVERPWGRMRVWRGGRGPAVLAVHGLGGSGRYWEGLVRRVGADYTIVAPDLPGFGSSDRPEGDIDRAMLLADLDAVIETQAGEAPVHVVGHSLGAVLAALWTSKNPRSVRSLAMASPPFPDGSAMDYRTRADLRPSTGRRLAAKATRAIWPALAFPIGLATRYPTAVVADFGRQSVRARAWTMWALWSDPGFKPELERIATLDGSIPSLLAHARDDKTVAMRGHASWMRVLPNAEPHVLDEGGHQFLLRTKFEPFVGWLAGEAAAD
ncbi:MAG TPA: alpha/beta hydrolase [Actinomycetota bacterium]